jgi:hypothetical protein
MYSAMAPGVRLLKPKMWFCAHPVVACQAVATLQHGTICSATTRSPTLIPAPPTGLGIELHYRANELMAGNRPRLRPGGPAAVAPELRSAAVALQIARADAGCLDLDQCLAGPGQGTALPPGGSPRAP